MSRYESRFITRRDHRLRRMLFDLPVPWWSRFYEYAWAQQFSQKGDIALDAACGLGHPFKFYLADHCREVHACDLDPRILSREAVLADMAETYGEQAMRGFPDRYLDRVRFAHASITDLPYPDGHFDKVYCISVLEHLPATEFSATLREFARVLRDDGLIILTVDYPTVDLPYLAEAATAAGLEFAGPASCLKPDDAIWSEQYRLHVFRAVFRKRRTARILVGSPIRQRPEVLKEFLASLERLDPGEAKLQFIFVDDNDQPESSKLLRDFADRHPTLIWSGEPKDFDYNRDEQTHRWREALIWRVARYKDSMIEEALQGGYDALFLADSDLVLHPLTVQHLNATRHEIISEIFWTKWTPEQPEMPQVWLHDHYGMHPHIRGERLTQEDISRRASQWVGHLRAPGIYPVGGLGACTLIQRRVLEAGVRFAEIYNVTFWGEDRHFCIRAAALGFELQVDTHLPAYHIYREQDLPGVAGYLQGVGAQTEVLSLLTEVRAGLAAYATSDFRRVTGEEGADYLTPELRAKRHAEREQAQQAARASRLIARAVTREVRGFRIAPERTRAEVQVVLVNEGEENGRPFRDELLASATLHKLDDRWLLDQVEFRPLERAAQTKPPAPVQHKTPFRRKSAGNRLTVSMVVRNEADRYLARVLEDAATYADDFVIIDDASEDNTVEVCRRAVGRRPVKLVRNRTSLFHHEIDLRQQQWRETIATKPDWILFLDADEIFEEAARTEISSLINQDRFDVIAFRLFDMWDQEYYREDQYWSAHKVYRPFLIRYQPDFTYRWRETAQHSGRMPANVLDLPAVRSELRLKHFGWADPADRQAKYDRYMRLDPEGKFGVLGQYRSIMDPNPRLIKWQEG